MSVAAVDPHHAFPVLALRLKTDEPIRLEDAMATQFGSAAGLKAEHRPAKHERIAQRRADDVLHNPRQAAGFKARPGLLYAIDMVLLAAADTANAGMRLARRRRPYEVEAVQRIGKRVGLMKFERVTRLRPDINANNLKARAVEAHCGPPRAAEQVQRLHRATCGRLKRYGRGTRPSICHRATWSSDPSSSSSSTSL
ncbi:hypothetical protein MPL1032_190141 [Mesorhizobium plurifarium]|uniref:Uncharacterized protein n=1 Tax=Mesorhizobium plurifarium TaxID=69974 RepID=A0A0K2VVL4_MESPL|nr:hypothetical protein MPL1032_190141 [Mesorhizobium plurifarium]